MVYTYIFRNEDDKSLVFAYETADIQRFIDDDQFTLVRKMDMYESDIEACNEYWNVLRNVADQSDNLSPHMQEFNAPAVGDFIRWSERGTILHLLGMGV